MWSARFRSQIDMCPVFWGQDRYRLLQIRHNFAASKFLQLVSSNVDMDHDKQNTRNWSTTWRLFRMSVHWPAKWLNDHFGWHPFRSLPLGSFHKCPSGRKTQSLVTPMRWDTGNDGSPKYGVLVGYQKKGLENWWTEFSWFIPPSLSNRERVDLR